jgi:hypothetical protein
MEFARSAEFNTAAAAAAAARGQANSMHTHTHGAHNVRIHTKHALLLLHNTQECVIIRTLPAMMSCLVCQTRFGHAQSSRCQTAAERESERLLLPLLLACFAGAAAAFPTATVTELLSRRRELLSE